MSGNKASSKTDLFRTMIAAIAAFCVYTCMYAYRKPFTAASFEGLSFLAIDYKIWLVIAQTAGYTLSKFFGIRYIAELKTQRRDRVIIRFIAVAWIALLGFALVPAPYNIIFLLLNGLPLGVIYGLVFSYLEGRRSTEFLGAVLSASFIFASGFTQSIGKWLMLSFDVNHWWMPFLTGAVFFLPLIFFTWLLEKTPAPTAQDEQERTARRPMTALDRKSFIRQFLPGLFLLIAAYVILTVVRDYRSNFAADIWKETGYGNDASVFTKSELLPSIVVLLLMSLLIFVRSNIRAFLLNHWIILFGFALTVFSTFLFEREMMNAFWWMTLSGTGLYMGYVPFNCMLFERLIASFKHISTAGFIIYVADSFGYLGSDVLMLVKNFSAEHESWTNFFTGLLMAGSMVGIVLTVLAAIYFRRKYQQQSHAALNVNYG